MTAGVGFDVAAEHLLFADSLAPITSEIGFVQSTLVDVVDAFVEWSRSIVHDTMRDRLGVVRQRSVAGSLDAMIDALLPLRTARPNRYLFVPTKGDYVAYFDNSSRGTDAFPVVSFLAEKLRTRGVRVLAVPDTASSAAAETSRYGGLVLEIYGSNGKDDEVNIDRHISLINDGGEWSFESVGNPMPFENIPRYSSRRVISRFTFGMLSEYCGALGVRPFDGAFYGDNAVLVEVSSKVPREARDVSLADARKSLGLD